MTQAAPVRDVLLVEDSETESLVLSRGLESRGCRVRSARNGAEALLLLESYRPELIVSDVLMPLVDGLELCRRVRADPRVEDIPVLLLTSLSDSTDVLRALECGASSFLTKPLSAERLVVRIDEVLSRPLTVEESTPHARTIQFHGEQFEIATTSSSMVDFLLASFEEVAQRSVELLKVRDELTALNQRLESRIEERTTALKTQTAVRHRAEMELRESEERFRTIFESAALGITLLDPGLGILVANRSVIDLVGCALSDLREKGFLGVVHPSHQEATRQGLSEIVAGLRRGFHSELRLLREGSMVVWARLAAAALSDGSVVVTLDDISQNKRDEETIHRLAYYDDLTGLANRSLFRDRLEQLMAPGRSSSEELAILRLGIDRFELLHDTLGQSVGDGILEEVASRLSKATKDGETLARVGNSEFMLLVPTVLSADEVARRGRSLLELLRSSIRAGTEELLITASIGASLFPHDGDDADSLIQNAGTALRAAARSGPDSCRLFASAMNAATMQRLTLEKDLRNALERNELRLVYQPQAQTESGKIIGVEALLRWRHPEQGEISPVQFIPLAEEIGIIGELTDWVLETALEKLQSISTIPYLGPVRMAVNLSARLFRERELVDRVARTLAARQIDSSLLDLELTEGAVMENPDLTIEILAGLKELGVQISIDDFGTGYSSLGYLQHFHIDILKIDRTFVESIGKGKEGSVLPRLIISMAHELGLRVIAEGVENEEQLAFLRTHSCDEVQGFLLSHPVEGDALETMLQKDARLLPGANYALGLGGSAQAF